MCAGRGASPTSPTVTPAKRPRSSENGLTESPIVPSEEFFDHSFLAELEALASSHEGPESPRSISSALHDKLQAFLRTGAAGEQAGSPLSEEAFVALSPASLSERTNDLLEVCRQSGKTEPCQAVENFIVFFQALIPTLSEDGSREIKRFFFRLVPTLIHIAYNDFSELDDRREDGRAALHSLESVLIEIASVRLAPSESELVFKSIDQMAAFIGVGEYAMASEIISSQLLSIIARNKLMRALFRLMEVEVSVQRYLKEKLGYPTPQLRVPEDIEALREYGPLRILKEVALDGSPRRVIQVQIPDIPMLRDVILHLAGSHPQPSYDLRLDSLGSAELSVPDGAYTIGLVYQPE
jgi:hypothetical protein